MTFGELKTELAERGFDYLSEARRGTYVNRGAAMLYDEEPWPFLETSVTDTAPLTISDFKTILYVVNNTTKEHLYQEDQRTLRDRDPDLSAGGAPDRWYLEGDEIKLYPSRADSITVRYVEVPDDMAQDADTPAPPSRYHNLIVDAAVYLAYKDTDEFDNAANLLQLWTAEVVRMRERLMDRDDQGNKSVVRTGSFIDWNA